MKKGGSLVFSYDLMRYIYRVENIKINMFFGNDNKKQEKQLNEIGADGWKLILISQGKKYLKYVFIKEVA